MATMVAGELYEKITGQLFELGRQLRQPNGYPFDPLVLKNTLQDAIEGRFASSSKFPHFNPTTLIGKGWSIAEDNEALATWNPASTRLVSILRKGETSVTGEEAIGRLAGDKTLGARALLYFWDNQEKIPEEWKGKLVFFDATILRSPSGHRYSLYLCWNDGRWIWHFDWLVCGRRARSASACAS